MEDGGDMVYINNKNIFHFFLGKSNNATFKSLELFLQRDIKGFFDWKMKHDNNR